MPLTKGGLPLAVFLRVFNVVTRLRGIGRCLRLLFDPRKIEDCRFEVWLGNFLYRGRTSHFIDWSILFYGAYEEHDVLVLQSVANEAQTEIFLDIGANVGEYAILMSGSCRRVIAFEPNPDLHEQFLGNLHVNGIKNVALQPVALGRADDSLTLHLGRDSGESSFLPNANSNNRENSIVAEVRRGDAFLRGIGISSGVGIVKIDVEGFEVHVLSGLIETLSANRPFVLLEVSPGGLEEFGNVDDFVAAFPPGYTFYRWLRKPGLRTGQALEHAGAEVVFQGYGNVYAVPEEKRDAFEYAVLRRPKRLRHRRLSAVRLIES
ncbi:MAG: FkbM family methyltransferase [Rhodospirillales bacterium]|nr:FkbM family methyltransferase [Rhodospirillales bacterium]